MYLAAEGHRRHWHQRHLTGLLLPSFDYAEDNVNLSTHTRTPMQQHNPVSQRAFNDIPFSMRLATDYLIEQTASRGPLCALNHNERLFAHDDNDDGKRESGLSRTG